MSTPPPKKFRIRPGLKADPDLSVTVWQGCPACEPQHILTGTLSGPKISSAEYLWSERFSKISFELIETHQGPGSLSDGLAGLANCD